MRWVARLLQRGRTRVRLITVLPAVAVFAVISLVPAASGATGNTLRGLRSALRGPARAAPASAAVTSTGQSFAGVSAVGALFTESSGKLGTHFCTATVVHSPHGDLAVTAAHCVTGVASQIAFVPGYASGAEPYGIWQVTRVYTDQAWQSSQDPDDDVAFLQLSGSIEDLTGAEQLSTDSPGPGRASTLVRVIGYPDGTDQPVWCVNWTKFFSPSQLEFDCGGYTNGTSGGPFLAGASPEGSGTVIGVIGGYQQGGDTPEVSYSPAFGPAVAVLYQTAETSS